MSYIKTNKHNVNYYKDVDFIDYSNTSISFGYYIPSDDYKLFEKAKKQNFKAIPDFVFFNDKKRATTLIFNGEPTVVRARDGDEYKRRIGFLEAYFQATCGMSKTKAKKYLERIVEGDNNE